MVEIDRVLPPINIIFEGNLDISEIYHIIKDFLKDKKCDIYEKEHNFNDGKLKIKWEGEENINDYMQFLLKVTLNGSKMKKVKLKDKEVFFGKFNFEIEAEIHRDYQDYYEGKPVIKFFKELFDFTVKKDETLKLSNQLKEQAYSLFDEIKAYLGLQKLK